MKNFIKKINVLAVVAMLVGGGFAFATASEESAPMYRFLDNTWSLIPPGEAHACNPNPEQDCTATGLDSNGEPIGVVKGNYIPLN